MRDHCTVWPDRIGNADWSHCCLAHDLAYWSGHPRLEADIELARCVIAAGNPAMALIMATGVILFGWIFYKRKPQ